MKTKFLLLMLLALPFGALRLLGVTLYGGIG